MQYGRRALLSGADEQDFRDYDIEIIPKGRVGCVTTQQAPSDNTGTTIFRQVLTRCKTILLCLTVLISRELSKGDLIHRFTAGPPIQTRRDKKDNQQRDPRRPEGVREEVGAA